MRLIILLILVVLTIESNAQWMSTTTTIRTPYGPAKIPSYHYVSQPMLYYSANGIRSAKHPFTIVLRNDSIITQKAKIDISEETNFIKIKEATGKKLIKPHDTREIYRKTSTGEIIKGIPADSCWLFKAVSGKINGYSKLAEKGIIYVIAIGEGDGGPIFPLTKENLIGIVVDDPKAMKLLEKDKLLEAIETYNKSTP